MWVPASWNVRGGPPGGRLAWAARRAAGRGRGPPSCLEGPHAGPARSFGRKPGLGGGRVLGAARPPLGSRYLRSIAGQGREGGRRAAVADGAWRVRGRRSRSCSGQRQLHARRARTRHTRSPYHGLPYETSRHPTCVSSPLAQALLATLAPLRGRLPLARTGRLSLSSVQRADSTPAGTQAAYPAAARCAARDSRADM